MATDRGTHQTAYYTQPRPDKPIGEIYADMDSYSGEVFADEDGFNFGVVTVFVALPPLRHDGVFCRGVLLSNAVEWLVDRVPEILDLFEVVAYSMWSAIAWSRRAHAVGTLYANPQREAWFREHNPGRQAQTLLPLLDSDWVNEAGFLPQRLPKDIDVLCVSRLDPCKNLVMLARALKVLRRKHPERPLRVTLATGSDLDLNWSASTPLERSVLRALHDELGHLPDHLHLIGRHDYFQMKDLYSRAKVYVLGSLLEGKNRGSLEAMCCNTPTVHFADYNWALRGDSPAVPPEAGLAAPHFDAESLADTLWTAVIGHGDFRARRALLGFSGRAHTFNVLLDGLPHFAAHLPEFCRGRHLDNAWLDAAIAAEYQQGLRYFVYGHNPFLTHRVGHEACLETLRFYRDRLA